MPISVNVDSTRRIVNFICFGILSDDDVQELMRAIRGTPEIDPRFDQLLDMRDVEWRVTGDDMRRYSEYHHFDSDSRRAVVAGDDLTFGLARMFQMLGDSQAGRVKVFRSYDEAIEWLRIDPEVAIAAERFPDAAPNSPQK